MNTSTLSPTTRSMFYRVSHDSLAYTKYIVPGDLSEWDSEMHIEIFPAPSLIRILVSVGRKLMCAASTRAAHVRFQVTPITIASAMTDAARAMIDPVEEVNVGKIRYHLPWIKCGAYSCVMESSTHENTVNRKTWAYFSYITGDIAVLKPQTWKGAVIMSGKVSRNVYYARR